MLKQSSAVTSPVAPKPRPKKQRAVGEGEAGGGASLVWHLWLPAARRDTCCGVCHGQAPDFVKKIFYIRRLRAACLPRCGHSPISRVLAVKGMTAMDLRTRINTSLKEAIKARDTLRISTLRLINAAIKDREIAPARRGRCRERRWRRRRASDSGEDGQAAAGERARLRRGRKA